ncbi:hypothetical protein [Burkholderia thailandensis]|uniref:hypothetical protein n=1 Tax=Burkholderia thailandensis TaxID=57975 RepID=UPI00016A98B0|nr:hypothetical protein [Burkholderia thailandensis]AOJ49100.1 hypothetical protein WJ27_29305 [Burkholderia thailandensis]AVR07388.1 hypothetical protein A8H31_07690 [Burkholderia thailandensis]AWY61234.1 hypothetical protein A8H35_23810 [Burkholderia thailandensis]AWY65311.1 hypothetical protein A8H36_08950 [Burkholderia thailandensis]KVG08644.1 hypothetical protein WJ25_14770 [Burkholderia thailandensis]
MFAVSPRDATGSPTPAPRLHRPARRANAATIDDGHRRSRRVPPKKTRRAPFVPPRPLRVPPLHERTMMRRRIADTRRATKTRDTAGAQ